MILEASNAMFFLLDGLGDDIFAFAWAAVVFFAVSHLFTRNFDGV
jgi:hypothetical protein